MGWIDLFPKEKTPSLEEVTAVVKTEAFPELNDKLKQLYEIEPALCFSRSSAQPGWNLKYKKNKDLCIIFPAEEHFFVQIAIGNNEMKEAEKFIPSCTEYVQGIFQNTAVSGGAKWLMFDVKDSSITEDLLGLIKIRKAPEKEIEKPQPEAAESLPKEASDEKAAAEKIEKIDEVK